MNESGDIGEQPQAAKDYFSPNLPTYRHNGESQLMDKDEIDFGETKVNTSVFQDKTPKTVYKDCNFLDESDFVKESHEFSTQTIDFD